MIGRAFLITALAIPLLAQWEADLSGYVKALLNQSESVLDQSTYYLSTQRIRLTATVDAGSWLHGEIWLDQTTLLGSYLKSPEYVLSRFFEEPVYLELHDRFVDKSNVVMEVEARRAFLQFSSTKWQATIGRQRVAWGSGFVWNPTDLFNPTSPLAIERDEKSGTDGLHMAYSSDGFSRLELAYAPAKGLLESRTAARYSGHFGNTDWALMAGDFGPTQVLGGDFASYLGDAGFRGEWAHTEQDDQASLQLVLNLDYTFSNDWYLMFEAFYNESGATNPANYRLTLEPTLPLRLARHYAALLASRELTPLSRIQLYGVFNLNDDSALWGPSLSVSLGQDLDFSLSSYLFSGPEQSELGRLEPTYFATFQYYY